MAKIIKKYSKKSLGLERLEKRLLYDGTPDNDVFVGTGADETYHGLAGNDAIYGSGGNDVLYGDDGNDTIDGGTGSDALFGGAGNDLFLVTGSDAENDLIIDGGAGSDTITASTNVTLNVWNSESLAGFPLVGVGVEFWNGQGVYGITGNENANLLDFAQTQLVGVPFVTGGSGNDTVIGNNDSNDFLFGGSEHDLIYGLGGNDQLKGEGGNDTIYGGAGNDTIGGGTQDDVLFGNEGNDYIEPGAGVDFVDAGDGNDHLFVKDDEGGSDTLIGGAHDANGGDILHLNSSWTFSGTSQAGASASPFATTPVTLGYFSNVATAYGPAMGIETVEGDNALPVPIQGTAGNNYLDFSSTKLVNIAWIDGGAGNDTIIGSADPDTLFGWDGDDVISGGPGKSDDVLIGEGGNDTLLGGEGNDLYYYKGGNATDGYPHGQDHIVDAGGTDTLFLDSGDLTTVRESNLLLEDNFDAAAQGVDYIVAPPAVGPWPLPWPLPQPPAPQFFYIDGDGSDNVWDFTGATIQGIDGIRSFGGNDQVIGSKGNDVIEGGDGNDALLGGEGNDILAGGNGDDVLNGGPGFDTADFSGSASPLTFNLDTGIVTGQGTDVLVSIENVVGGAGNDTFNVSFSTTHPDNMVIDGTGNRFGSSSSNDVDTLNISGSSFDDYFEIRPLSNGYIQIRISNQLGVQSFDVDNVEKININGLEGNDKLVITNSGTDDFSVTDITATTFSFNGGAGNDVMDASGFTPAINVYADGGDGDDSLIGGLGNDELHGGNGSDTIRGGGGNDNIFGEGGLLDSLDGGSGDDNIDGGDGHDAIYGGDGNDVLRGGASEDSLNGGPGNDKLIGGEGNDFLTGGGGDDTVSYEDAPGKVVLTLVGDAIVPAGTALAGTAGGNGDGWGTRDLYITNDIQNVIGSAQDDWLIGNDNANKISSGGGADTIYGLGGDDILKGDAGNDVIDAGAGNDIVEGGDGNDWIVGRAGDDNIKGNSGDDIIYGDDGNDVLEGGDGTDTVIGGLGDDRIVASGNQAEFDNMWGDNADGTGAGMDTLFDPVDNDVLVLNYFDSTDPNSPDADKSHDIESIVGANAAKPIVVSGNDSANKLDFTNVQMVNVAYIQGLGGDDSIWGTAYADSIRGNAGDDRIFGLGGDDVINGGTDSNVLGKGDTLNGGAGNDKFLAAFDEAQYDSIFGGGLLGATGDSDTLENRIDPPPGGANPTAPLVLNGFNSFINSIEVLNGNNFPVQGNSNANQLHFFGTQLVNVKYIDGKSGNDYITGSSGGETILGGGGNDTLDGWIGNDWLKGEEGNDLLVGYSGNDTLDGGTGNDTVWGETDDDLFIGRNGETEFDIFRGGPQINGDKLFIVNFPDPVTQMPTNLTLNTFGPSSEIEIIEGQINPAIPNAKPAIVGNGYGNTLDFSATTFVNIAYVSGGAGNDVITGTNGNDLLYGGAGDDTVSGGAGNDDLYGEDGNDVLSGGDGNDFLVGGAGNDSLSGGTGNDIMRGNDGDDTLRGGPGVDTMDGGAGLADWADYIDATGGVVVDLQTAVDTSVTPRVPLGVANPDGNGTNDLLRDIENVNGSNFADTIFGSDWDNTINGNGGNDSIYGRAGNDVINGGDGVDYVEGGDGNDLINGGNGNDVLLGQTGNDTINGNDGNDQITGGQGLDVLSGGAGDDQINGNEGDDIVNGDAGNDALYGGADNDIMSGGIGNDYIEGNAGNDSINGNEGDDVIFGGADDDTVYAGEGADFVSGENGNDVIFGQAGADNLFGGTGDDKIDGGVDADWLEGGGGNDYLFGNMGEDTLWGGEGNDIMTGGTETDRFVFGPVAFGSDVVTDFTGGEKLDYTPAGIVGWGSLNAAAATTYPDSNSVTTWLVPPGGGIVTVLNYHVGSGDVV